MAATILQKAKTQMVIQEPFYATILCNLAVVETKSMPDGRDLWIAATNGTELFLNPENFNKLTVAEAKGVLKHEVMHIANLHPWRGQGKERRRWNHACDYAINPMILEEGGELPTGVLDGSAFVGKTAEQIYQMLPPMDDNDGDNGGMHDDLMPAKDTSAAGQAKAQTMISQAVQAAKARDKLPSFVKSLIEDVFKPRIDWKEALRQWLTAKSPSDYSFRRPNRMFMTGPNKMYLPGLDGHDDMECFGVLLDTSGSITHNELSQGLGEIVGAVTDVNPKKLVVAYCDSAVQHADVFENPGEAEVAASFERHGAGGTSMPSGLKWFKRNHPTVQAVMVWTDGYTDWGDQADYPFDVLWCISTPEIVAPWGETIHVEIIQS